MQIFWFISKQLEVKTYWWLFIEVKARTHYFYPIQTQVRNVHLNNQTNPEKKKHEYTIYIDHLYFKITQHK